MKCYRQYVVMGLNLTLMGTIRFLPVFTLLKLECFQKNIWIKGPSAKWDFSLIFYLHCSSLINWVRLIDNHMRWIIICKDKKMCMDYINIQICFSRKIEKGYKHNNSCYSIYHALDIEKTCLHLKIYPVYWNVSVNY